MKKLGGQNEKKISILFLTTSFIIRIILLILKKCFQYVLIYDLAYSIINIVIIMSLLVFIFTYFKNKKVFKLIKILSVLLISIYIFIAIGSYSLNSIILSPTSRFYYWSPNGKNKLLLEESENITGCTITGYIVVCNIFKIDNEEKYYTEVGFGEPDTPISKGNFKIIWKNNYEVNVKVFSDSQDKFLTVKF